MSDYKGQLPVRSKADGTDERVLVKHQDGDDPSGVGKTQEISEKKAHVRNFSKDSDGVDQEVLLSQEGHTQSNGDYDVATNKRPSSQGLIVSDRDASPDETTMNLRPTAVAGEADSVCQDIALHDAQGQAIDEDNPLATYLAESPADEVDDYDAAVAAVKDVPMAHDYAVTALKTFKSISFVASGSGYIKAELQIETAVASGVYTTVCTRFNSTAQPNCRGRYTKKVLAGIKVRVEKTNLDNQPSDTYSEIKGLEV
jgi:hypothetical protein